jgi:hypothetical protein
MDNLSYQGISNNAAGIQLFHSDSSAANLYIKHISVGMKLNNGGAVVIASNESSAYIQDVRTNIPITYPYGQYENHVHNADHFFETK